MKKPKGAKRKVTHYKKQNKHLSFLKRFLPVILIFTVLLSIIVLLIINHPATGNVITGNADAGTSGTSFLDNSISVGVSDWTSWLDVGNTWRDLLVFSIVFIILLTAIADMMMLLSLFSNWVSWIIAAGIAIIGALTSLIRQISIFLITTAAGLGAIGVFVEVIIVIVIFIGLSFGSSKIALFAAKRRAQREHIKSIKGAGEATAAIAGLRAIEAEFSQRKGREKLGS